jgi:glyoxylase-like metal-dependent hydrolase (beta-lactamase superfamily II)
MKITEEIYAFFWTNPMANNCNTFLIDGEQRILIDPGHYHLLSHVKEGLSELSLSLQDIDIVIITHGHPDHIEGIKAFFETPTHIAIHKTEVDFIKRVAPHYGQVLGTEDFQPDIFLKEGDLKISDLTFEVINTPGHSPGSVCLYWPEKKVLFTGDVVFNQGIGRTDLPAGNGQELKESIKRISRLDVEYLLPGHGEMISGHDNVANNFEFIKSYWFQYI